MKQDVDDLKTAAAKHAKEMKSLIEIACAGSIEEINNILRGHREIKEQEQVLIYHHEKVKISQGQLREDERGLRSCYEDIEAKKRRLFSTTPE